MTSPHDTAIWERGWEGHELAQLRRLARLPLSEKLQWLDEAHGLMRYLSHQQLSPASSASPAGSGAEDSTSPHPSSRK